MAILEDDKLVELLVDRPDMQRTVGNLYLGKVEAVLPAMQAAFIDIGTDKSGFLHASDLVEPEDDDLEDDEENGDASNGDAAEKESAGKKSPESSNKGRGRGRRRFGRIVPDIKDVLRRGQEILVQVTKEPIGTKGPRITSQISLPGRFLVYMPQSSKVGVSRKIESRQERARLRKIVQDEMPRDGGGVIIRTVAQGLEARQIKRELKSLLALWKKIKTKKAMVKAPDLVQREGSLASGVIRDVFSDQVDNLYVESKRVYADIKQYLKQVDPDLLKRVVVYEEDVPLFDKFDIEPEIRTLFQRRVDLPAGGYLIIEPTEALVSIDINTGRYTGGKGSDPEKTILRTNLEAAREVGRQLRLRDMGGIIVIDFIDMENQRNRDKVLRELRLGLSRDRARTKTHRVSELGLVEMTRQRVRPSLLHSMSTTCPGCNGTGHVFRPEVVTRRLERGMKRFGRSAKEKRMVIRLHPEVALYLLEEEPAFVENLSGLTGVEIEVRDDPTIQLDEYRLIVQPAGRDVTDQWAVA